MSFYCLLALSSMWPSTPPPQSCDTQFCTFPSLPPLIAVVSFGLLSFKKVFLAHSGQHRSLGWASTQRKGKQSQIGTMSSARGNSTRLPFAIMYSGDKEEKGTLKQALSSLSKALFFNDSSAFRCKAWLLGGGTAFVLLMAQIYLEHIH